jgi:RNA polymerase sigma-70 factor (ECF subfamily)
MTDKPQWAPTAEEDFDRWLREIDTTFTSSLAQGLDLGATLVAVRARATARAATAAQLPAAAGAETGRPVVKRPCHTRRVGQDRTATLEALVHRHVHDGDSAAAPALLREIHPLVVKYCRARMGRDGRSYLTSDDVAQDVCLAVMKSLQNYRNQGAPFLGFVYGIAQHKIADAYRAIARDHTDRIAEPPEQEAPGPTPEGKALETERRERIRGLLDRLPAKQREILTLRQINGLTAEETAEMIGSSPGAVRVAQHRAMSRLRQMLQDIKPDAF